MANTTSWVFPPALNITFRDAYVAAGSNRTATGLNPKDLLPGSVQNLTLPQRVDSRFTNTGWGGASAVVNIGDVLEFDWNGVEKRVIGMECQLCSLGAGGGSIENACNNYTDTSRVTSVTSRSPQQAPRSPYAIPPFMTYNPLPASSCGICLFELFSIGDLNSNDFSVPFSILNQPASPHKRFNADHPTGSPDASIKDVATSTGTPPPPQTHGPPNVGMIVGVVVGVIVFVGLVALLLWWRWRKQRASAKHVDSSASSAVGGARAGSGPALPSSAGAGQRSQNVPLRRFRSVVRRPDSRAGEIPPTYHEAVRQGQAHQPQAVIDGGIVRGHEAVER